MDDDATFECDFLFHVKLTKLETSSTEVLSPGASEAQKKTSV